MKIGNRNRVLKISPALRTRFVILITMVVVVVVVVVVLVLVLVMMPAHQAGASRAGDAPHATLAACLTLVLKAVTPSATQTPILLYWSTRTRAPL